MIRAKIRNRFLFLIIGLFGAVSQVYAFCTPAGWTASCSVNGVQGYKVCGTNGFFGPCITPPPEEYTGDVVPKYKVLTVVYAPPGTQGGGSSSSVNYGLSSSLGSTVSASNSFNNSYSVSVTASGGVLGSGGSIGGSWGFGVNSMNSESMDIKKSASLSISRAGPSVDGIDHNRDQIWLWLGPKVNMTMTPNAGEWTIDNSEVMDLQYVYVGWLKNPSQMPPGVTDRLEAYGITTADYPEILKANPLADPSIPLDTNRYKSVYTTFPYEPPYAANDPVSTLSFTATFGQTSSSSSSVTNQYTVGMTQSGSVGFENLFTLNISQQSKWTWTDSDTRANSSGTSESASVTVGGPSFGYTGPTAMQVYYDVIYKTFAFVPIPPGGVPPFQGSLVSISGQPLSSKEVVVTAGDVEYRTFTNARGEYRLYGDIPTNRPLEFKVDGLEVNSVPFQEDTYIVMP
ncbi:hypothetical protein [Microbulbifer sp. TYP-18]|uniref:hypothetical protein n=1 Tax=Microbulbifer sp. TYP-18 TaxID=3230024 RepID=UPI0034C6812E